MEPLYRPVKFGEEWLMKSLDAHVDRMDSNPSQSLVKRALVSLLKYLKVKKMSPYSAPVP
jgi:hypothetical protein